MFSLADEAMKTLANFSSAVMTALEAAIQDKDRRFIRLGMAGSTPAMTMELAETLG
jgi:hypothetical protein